MTNPLSDGELLEQLRLSLDAHERHVDQGLVERASRPVLARRRRSAALRVGAITVAMLVLVGLVAMTQLRGRTLAQPAGHSAPAATGAATTTTATANDSDTRPGHTSRTVADMAALLSTITPVRGAVRHLTLATGPPAAGVDLSSSVTGSAKATVYWTTGASPAKVAAALSAGAMGGYRVVPAPGAGSASKGTMVVVWAGRQVHPAWIWPVVEFTITADSAGAVIRGDAMASVRDARAADTVLPPDARLAAVHLLRVTKNGEPVASDLAATPSLDTAVRSALANLGPSLGRFVAPPLWLRCDPNSTVIPDQTTYTFTTATGTWSVRSTGGCLPWVTVSDGVTVAPQQLLPDATWQKLEAGLGPTR